MTLFVVILFGLGSVLIISGIENVSLLETTQDIWNNTPPTGKSSGQTASGQAASGTQIAGRGGAVPLPSVSSMPSLPTWADVRASYVQTWAHSQGR